MHAVSVYIYMWDVMVIVIEVTLVEMLQKLPPILKEVKNIKQKLFKRSGTRWRTLKSPEKTLILVSQPSL